MNQKHVICVLGTLSAFAATGATAQQKASKPLNIVYIMSDDHTQQMISCYDKRYIQTPNIDAIAREGVRFTESFVANSLSGPSRACMLTGKHSHKNGKLNNEHQSRFDQGQQTMPKILQSHGYQTALVGKLHLEGIPQGFDYWTMLPGQGDYYDPKFIRPKNMKAQGEGVETVKYQGYVTNIITDLSLEWLEQRDKEKPFALFIHHKAAHRNWMADTLDLKSFEDQEYELPDTFYDNYEGRLAAQKHEMGVVNDLDMINDLKMLKGAKPTRLGAYYSRKNDTEGCHGVLRPEVKQKFKELYDPLANEFYAANLGGEALARWKFARYMRDYSKVVKSLDRNIGRVLDYLREHNLLENTLIVYTSDQGFYMGEHGWYDKRFMYEESMRTPLVMRLPQHLGKRGDVTEMVQNIDYAPTFLDMAGIPIPEDMQGESMLPLLDKRSKKKWTRNSLYYHFYEYPGEHAVRRHYGVRTKRYKLIHFYGDIDTWELYDLKKDPKELNNLYGNPKYKKVTEEMHKELERVRKLYDVTPEVH
ncbi:sulfatase [Porphyromonas sp. COT-239 OH1446]|uniref:sulfatase family protein n=1 Tax=Porphyromonas sp. COT-239 OH1446 TaxID=1515613 RepID=UPI00052C25D7|nr:sulfatase [Porphyromonas sp. COT-239 OH1446]KGN70142.1 sulfatase [Porphyromonas sp. COT-239 OH1446]